MFFKDERDSVSVPLAAPLTTAEATAAAERSKDLLPAAARAKLQLPLLRSVAKPHLPLVRPAHALHSAGVSAAGGFLHPGKEAHPVGGAESGWETPQERTVPAGSIRAAAAAVAAAARRSLRAASSTAAAAVGLGRRSVGAGEMAAAQEKRVVSAEAAAAGGAAAEGAASDAGAQPSEPPGGRGDRWVLSPHTRHREQSQQRRESSTAAATAEAAAEAAAAVGVATGSAGASGASAAAEWPDLPFAPDPGRKIAKAPKLAISRSLDGPFEVVTDFLMQPMTEGPQVVRAAATNRSGAPQLRALPLQSACGLTEDPVHELPFSQVYVGDLKGAWMAGLAPFSWRAVKKKCCSACLKGWVSLLGPQTEGVRLPHAGCCMRTAMSRPTGTRGHPSTSSTGIQSRPFQVSGTQG